MRPTNIAREMLKMKLKWIYFLPSSSVFSISLLSPAIEYSHTLCVHSYELYICHFLCPFARQNNSRSLQVGRIYNALKKKRNRARMYNVLEDIFHPPYHRRPERVCELHGVKYWSTHTLLQLLIYSYTRFKCVHCGP